MEIFRLGVLKQVPVIDITSVFLERRNHFEYLCDDGIHPNDDGHALIENAIMEYLRRLKIVA
jgi:lysophospholipase L1-like esterase